MNALDFQNAIMDSICVPKLFTGHVVNEKASKNEVKVDDGNAWYGGSTSPLRVAYRSSKTYKVSHVCSKCKKLPTI